MVVVRYKYQDEALMFIISSSSNPNPKTKSRVPANMPPYYITTLLHGIRALTSGLPGAPIVVLIPG